ETAIAARASERHDLARGHEALLDAAGSPDRLQPEVQRESERRGIAETAGHRDGVSAERVAALGAVRPVQRHRQAGLQPYAQRAVRLAEGGEGLLEERDPVVVGADPLASDAAEGDRGTAEHAGAAETPADGGSVGEGLARRVRLTGAPLGLAQRQQQLAAQPRVALRL